MSKEETTLKSKTYQALGTASMCWSEAPNGVFDSNEAQKVGDELWESIQNEIKEVAIGFAEFINDNCYIDGNDKWSVLLDDWDESQTLTTEQLYQQYLNQRTV